MPIPIKLKQKKIKLNDECKKIISIIHELNNENPLNTAPLKEIAKSRNESPWGKFLSFVDFFLGDELFNKTYLTIPAVEFDLDAQAHIVYQFYQNYLNEMLKKNNLDSSNTEKEIIEDKSVLLREILLRIVGITLRVKIDDIDHGEKMIKFLGSFVDKLTLNEVFIEKSKIFSDKFSHESISLVTDHNDWICLIAAMVNVIKIIHAPTTSISTVLTYLEQTKLSIVRFIIVLSDYSLKDDELSESWLITTFMSFEQHMQSLIKTDQRKEKSPLYLIGLANNKTDLTNNKGALISSTPATNSMILPLQDEQNPLNIEQTLDRWQSTKTSATQEIVIAGITKQFDMSNDDNKVRIEKIKDLYNLLNKTNLLFQIATQLESLIQIGGWVPILTGVINTSNFANFIEEHDQECRTHLRFSNEQLKLNAKNRGYHQLVKFSSRLFTGAANVTHNLQILSSNKIRSQLFKLIAGSLHQLQALETELLETTRAPNKEKLYLVNKDKLKGTLLMISSSPSDIEKNTNSLTVISQLDSNKIISGSIDDFCDRLINNTHINLFNFQISDVGMIKLAKTIHGNTNILELNLYNNKLYDASMKYIVDIIKRNKNLVHVNLGWNHFTDNVIDSLIEGLQVNRSVKQLCLYGNTFGESLNKLYILFGKNGFIKELDIGHITNKFNPEKFLKTISESTLTSLYLSNVYKDFKNINIFLVLADFVRKNNMIEHIIFSENGAIQDKDASDLALAILENVSLKILDLKNCKMTDDGAKYFHETMPKRLKWIQIINNSLSNLNKSHKRTLLHEPHHRDITYYLNKAKRFKNSDIDSTLKLANTYIKIHRLLPIDKQNEYAKNAKNSIESSERIIKNHSDKWGDYELQLKDHRINHLKWKLRYQEYLNTNSQSDACTGIFSILKEIIIKYKSIDDISVLKKTHFKDKTLCQIILMILKPNLCLFQNVTDELKQFLTTEQIFWLKMYKFTNDDNYKILLKKEYTQLSDELKNQIIKLMEDDCNKLYKTKNLETIELIITIVDILGIENAKIYAYKGLLALNDNRADEAIEFKNKSLKLTRWNNDLAMQLDEEINKLKNLSEDKRKHSVKI